jgi:hypothetical protein
MRSCATSLREQHGTYFFALKPSRGKFNTNATQYPLMRKRKVRKAWTAASGIM